MSTGFKFISWNAQKKIYDIWLWVGILLYFGIFMGVGLASFPNAHPMTLLIRASATAAFLLLTIILCIGPLCRLDNRFLPLLYNRRHMGVSTFLVASVHVGLVILWYHGFGSVSPLVNIFSANPNWTSLANFPFQPLGFVAFLILALMAGTSHDLWLHKMSAKIWKSLHMLVYVAYALIVMHIAMGILQQETSLVYDGLLFGSLGLVLGLHLATGFREKRRDGILKRAQDEGFVRVCRVDEILENAAKIAVVGEERIAVFKYDGKISVVSNVCQHQNGPLGEGKIIDGCITCPWHGYQYLPENGCSPPPFTEKIETFEAHVEDGWVFVNPKAKAPGTAVAPVILEGKNG